MENPLTGADDDTLEDDIGGQGQITFGTTSPKVNVPRIHVEEIEDTTQITQVTDRV